VLLKAKPCTPGWKRFSKVAEELAFSRPRSPDAKGTAELPPGTRVDAKFARPAGVGTI